MDETTTKLRAVENTPDPVVEAAITTLPRVRKAPPKYYRIGEVIQYSGLSRQTIHNYTVLGLITEATRTPAGHRLYGEEVFVVLERIVEMRKSLTLQQIRRAFERERQQQVA